jgi:hypothetical protein
MNGSGEEDLLMVAGGGGGLGYKNNNNKYPELIPTIYKTLRPGDGYSGFTSQNGAGMSVYTEGM